MVDLQVKEEQETQVIPSKNNLIISIQIAKLKLTVFEQELAN